MLKTLGCHFERFFVGWIFLAFAASANAEPATDQSIREYLQLSGIEASAIESYKQMLPAFRQMAKNIPEDLWRELSRTDNLLEKVIPIYRKYFSEEEAQDLIGFYKTATGMRLAKLSSTIGRELSERGAREAQMIITNYYIQKGNFTIEKRNGEQQ